MSTPWTVLVTDPLHAAGLERLRATTGCRVLDFTDADEAAWRPELPHVHGWIVRSGTKITAEHLAEATSLRAVARAGVGVDNVDVVAATERGVLVMNAPDANSTTTAELAIAHLFAVARHVAAGDRMVRGGGWDRKRLTGIELEGKTLGVVGLGRIGRKVAAKGRALGMRIVATDPYVAPAAVADEEVHLLPLEGVLEEADFVSLHLPLTDGTRNLIDADQLARMKPTASLINCARGGLIDAAALATALTEGRLRAAGLDVFAQEPPAADDPLLALPQVVLTPHLGASTTEASEQVALDAATQVLDALNGTRIRHAVNLPLGSMSGLAALRPFLDLARAAGRMLSQIADWPVTKVRAEYRGEVAATNPAPVTLAFLEGLLGPVLDRPVNLVNARALAEDRGIVIEETRSTKPRDFSSLLTFDVETAEGPRQIGAALFGTRMPRVVLLDEARLEIVPEGHVIVLRHDDQPGVIGRVGTLIGDAGLNIERMHVSPPARDGRCYAVLAVSQPAPASTIEAIRALDAVHRYDAVDLT